MGRGWPPWVAALGAVLGVLVLVGEPGIFGGEVLVGNGTQDVWGHVWGYWWTAEAVADGRFPYRDAPLLHPGGQTWWIVDLPVAVALVPLTRLAGPAATYHAALLGHVGLLAGGVAVWLGRHGVADIARASAGLLAGSSPFVLGVLASGVPEALAIAWLPWFALALDAGAAGHRRATALACLLAALLVLDGLYAAVAGGLVGGALVLAAVRQDGWQPAVRSLPVASAGLVAALAGWGAMRASDHPATVRQVGVIDQMPDTSMWVVAPRGGADLLNFFAPSFLLPEAADWHLHRHVAYLGLALLVAAGLGAWRDRVARSLVVLGAVAALLALGSRLYVGGFYTAIPLPGGLLGAAGAHNTYRLAGLTTLCLVGAAAFAWERLPRRVALPWAAVVLFEGLLAAPLELPVPTVPHPAGAAERWLASRPGDGAVLDLPLDREGGRHKGPFPQRTFALQTVHGRPVASGLYLSSPTLELETVERVQDAVVELWKTDPRYQRPWPPRRTSLWDERGQSPALRAPPAAVLDADRTQLQAMGFAFVLVDNEAIPPGAREPIRALLVDWLGEPVQRTEWREVYALGDLDDQ